MVSRKTKFILAITSIVPFLFWMSSVSFADVVSAVQVSNPTSQIDISKTDSKGSYSHDDDVKSEGSKSKSDAAGAHGFTHKKSEGSAGKSYSGSRHPYVHGKKEGSGSKGYSHKSRMYSHKKEGSGSRSYSHGSAHKKSYSPHKSSGHSSFHRSGKSPFEHVLCFKKKLGLTEEQVAKIKAHEFEFKKMKIQTKADHAIAHMELDRLVHSETVDEAGIQALADRISEIKSRKIHAIAEAKIAILKILTPEQRQRVSKMHSGH